MEPWRPRGQVTSQHVCVCVCVCVTLSYFSNLFTLPSIEVVSQHYARRKQARVSALDVEQRFDCAHSRQAILLSPPTCHADSLVSGSAGTVSTPQEAWECGSSSTKKGGKRFLMHVQLFPRRCQWNVAHAH